jgi:hypothetical protein
VQLSAKVRKAKDKDSQRRARRKHYAQSGGLTSTLLDAWWSECLGLEASDPPTRGATAGSRSAAGAGNDVKSMSGEQAVAFFSRSGLPTGARDTEASN